ncbi:EcsC family protein [Metabacillus fastidiosus]|uniref:EcsC family protein n=1 Tax=Metabacillus fastidiosus TaxID=1458 RepID=UPI003D2D940A
MQKREDDILEEIRNWEQILAEDNRSDFSRTVDKWSDLMISEMPETLRERFFAKYDSYLLHLHSFIQSSQTHQDTKRPILLYAKTLNPNINHIHDLQILTIDQLHYIADIQTSKHRLYSFFQGGLTSLGGLSLASLDIPSQVVINLRAVQMIAMCYGFETNNPFEMMTSLKVYYASLLPNHLKYEQWLLLKDDLNMHKGDTPYFYDGVESVADNSVIEFLVKQIIKLSFIMFFKRKLTKGIPVLGAAIGAGYNYQMTKKVTEFAHNYYRYRLLMNSRGERNE